MDAKEGKIWGYGKSKDNSEKREFICVYDKKDWGFV